MEDETSAVLNTDFAAINPDFPFYKQLYCRGKGLVLSLLNTGGKRFLRVILFYRNYRLEDNRSGVRTAINEVDRAAGKANTVVQGLLLGVQSLEGGKQGRVDIHDRIRIGADHDVGQDSHETGKDYQLHIMTAQDIDRCGVV